MNKKSLYAILSVVVSMIVLSVTLVLAIGPRISADSEEIVVLDKAEYFVIEEEIFGGFLLGGLTDEGKLIAENSQRISVVIPEGVTSIYGSIDNNFKGGPVYVSAFSWVRGNYNGPAYNDYGYKVESITLPTSLKMIGEYAFSKCRNLKSINIPDTVTTIGARAFGGCSNLKNVFIPASVETIGSHAFDEYWHTVYCEVADIPSDWDTEWYYRQPMKVWNPEYYVPDYNCPYYRWNCATDGEFIYQLMDDNTYGVVTYLGDEQAIVLPKSFNDVAVTTIPEGAFADCENLTAVTFPSSIATIGSGAFAGTNLETIVIPDNVITMGEAVFEGCPNLTTIYCEVANKPAGWERYWDWTWDWCNAADTKWEEGTEPDFDENGWADTDNINVEWGYVTKYQVTFNANNGTAVDTLTVNKRNTVTAPETPVKDGYEFKGWYVDEALTNEYDFDAAVTDDVNLYAKWEAVQAQPEQPEPETPAEENTEVNNQNNAGLIWGIAGTSAGVLIIAGVTVGIVIAKRRRK